MCPEKKRRKRQQNRKMQRRIFCLLIHQAWCAAYSDDTSPRSIDAYDAITNRIHHLHQLYPKAHRKAYVKLYGFYFV